MRDQGHEKGDSETPDLRHSISAGLLALSESLSLCLPLPTSPHDTPQRDRSRPRTPQKSRRGPSRTAALPARLAPALL
ncbi:hypothetical protein JMJ77_0007715 [Colletotrichum scovillei]|uniref:Uncharacterized protein n=1 Tax=Colletotrichum scovillei TaxID=1209932 RepID=A0A9P7RDI2_9PEZI|nr:hypothetical protein JMJ77_0007715 [Colletotrichum scovillei]KAG7074695.1 hypothetical protein JMJ76_0011169 [Colletotrichum scovillei]KAG7081883.1 hypothetical protein JMJ78_0003995 [Colletotrichum scovillei]